MAAFPTEKCAVRGCPEPPVEHSGVFGNIMGVPLSVGQQPVHLETIELPLCAEHQRAVEKTYAPKPGELSIEPNTRQHGEVTGRWDSERGWH